MLHRVRWLLVLTVVAVCLQAAMGTPAEWTRPFPPFRIVGNVYYVGSEDLAAYLLTTPAGHILINGNLPSSPAQIRHSIERLGFKMRDVRVLLISHAHVDHAGGAPALRKMTGASYQVMDGDVSTVESGGKTDFEFATDRSMWFPPTHVDRVLHDGDRVELGGTVLVAHKTAGHTPGTTTWTTTVTDAGRDLHVVIVGSPNVLDSYKLVGNTAYPKIRDDFRRQFEVLESLPCDVFLGAHGSYFSLKSKYRRLKAGDAAAFIDPGGYRAYVAERKAAFEARLR